MNAPFSRLRQVRVLFRLRPFDTSTEAGRSQERYRRIVQNGAGNALSRGTMALSSLLTVPMTLNHLGAERYGVFLTVGSFILMLGFADLGLSNGVQAAISRAHGLGDDALARRVLTSSLVMLTSVAALIVAFYFTARPLLRLDRLFNVHDALTLREVGPAAAVMVVCFALSVPTAITQRARVGFQEGVRANICEIASALLRILFLYVATRAEAGLPMLILAMNGGSLLAGWVSTFLFFLVEKPHLRPRFVDIDRSLMITLVRTGLIFVALQLATSLATNGDNLIIAHLLGPDSVPAYDVPMRLFTLGIVTTLTAVLLQPLWPAYGEAFVRRDYGWIRKALKRTTAVALAVSAPLAIVLVVFGKVIIGFWIGPGKVDPSWLLLAGMGLWALLSVLGNGVTQLLNGCNVLLPQVYCAIAFAAVGFGVKLIAAPAFGLEGIIWSAVIAYAVCLFIPLVWVTRGILRRHDRALISNEAT